MKNVLKEIAQSIEYKLRYLCGVPSPGKRLAFVVSIVIICVAINFYFIFTSIYNMGKYEARKEMLEIKHIDAPVLIPESVKDSIHTGEFDNDLKG